LPELIVYIPRDASPLLFLYHGETCEQLVYLAPTLVETSVEQRLRERRHWHLPTSARSIDLVSGVNGLEEVHVNAVIRADQQVPVISAGIAEHAHQLRLPVAVKMAENMTTRNQVEPRKRRIVQNIVGGEHDEIANFGNHPVVIAVTTEEAIEAFVREIGVDCLRVEPLSRDGQGPLIQVGREDIQLTPTLVTPELLAEEHGQCVRLFTSRARWHPHTNSSIA